MRFPIDVVFLDRSRKTVKVVERLRSGRVVLPVSQATSVLELPAGTINRTGTSLGDLISITEADTDGSGSVRSGQDTGGPVNIPATVSGPPISGGEL